MITIIHGDDIAASRSFLLEQKQKDKNVVSFFGGFSISDLVQNIEGSSLFFETKTIAIEDFFAMVKKKSREITEIADFINRCEKKANIFFWEGKELGKRDLSLFPKALVKQFKLPKALFSCLDNLLPNNGKNSILSFHKALQTSALELVIFMIQRQFRLLLALSDSHTAENIDEAIRLASWQRQRLERQSSCFSQKKLKEIYRKLYEIELAQRTGNLNLTLTQSIDFLLLGI